MKSFNTLVLAATAALTTAQFTTNPDGTFTCAIPNAAYCAGDSLSTNIIIRCIGTVGQPGNCNDNLDAEPPFGLNFSPCWQPSATSGTAACSKNCIVYGSSGNYNGTFTLPDCVPTTTVTTASTSTISTSISSYPLTSTIEPLTSYTTIVTKGTTITVPCPSVTPTTTPSGTAPTTLISAITAPSGGSSIPAGNGTLPTSTLSTPGGPATATPVGPTSTGPASFTGAAVANQAGVALAAGGLFMAYFL